MKPITAATPALHSLFAPLSYHLAVESILCGLTPGSIYVDDPAAPRLALSWFHSRVYLAGESDDPAKWEDVRATLARELVPQMRNAGMDAFMLDAELPETLERFSDGLPDCRVIPGMRRSYICDQLVQSWRTVLPSGYELRRVDADLLADSTIENLDWLQEEMVSERPSLEDFLAQSFGVCLVQDNRLAGWCLSEYNCDGRCEVGVATDEAHQQRGLGTAMSLALVEEAFHRGLRQVGWHCWARNTASVALAQRSGFRLEREYPVLLYLFEDS